MIYLTKRFEPNLERKIKVNICQTWVIDIGMSVKFFSLLLRSFYILQKDGDMASSVDL